MTRHFDLGHALWFVVRFSVSCTRLNALTGDPALPKDSKSIQREDVVFIRRGRVSVLFPAGCPLGDRRFVDDVPSTFKQLDTGEINKGEPLAAGYLCTSGIQAT